MTRTSNQIAIIALLLAVQYSCIATVSASTTYEGYGTVYTLSSPSSGNCNFMSWPSDATTKYAALNVDQWDETMNCGRCAEVSCTDSSCSGQSSEIVYIMDQCPGCSYGDLDLSPDVFESITGQSYTKLGIEWKFVDCPISKNVEYCLKTGSSEFWVAVQPANFVSGVESLKINGQGTNMVDSAYYFLIDGSGKSIADLSSVSISLTGVNGEVLEETVSLSADACTEGVGLALYVRRRKKQIDAYKRREEQGTAMSDDDTSPRASDVASATTQPCHSELLDISHSDVPLPCSWVTTVSASTTYEGYGTVYTLSSPSSGNCNFMSWPSDATTKYAALNVDQWDETMNCGRCAEVSCTDSSCSGQSSEIVYIMDQCPGCSYGDLDLSPDVFESITGQSYTKLGIEWKFVDCPISKNVEYCLKTGSSEFWVAWQKYS
ncbi:hypothetical protein JM18_008162 [Phytophthora kernoviae]|uniref:Expansin-like EG45 domain-containing protein n=2 Tax=Phytophthora kernoviae TaxID=325452 RepID=A0A8T0LXV4_9STRA|nr:hypothetical protein G195_009849 [Phytophthora kernoviae 00238/432]KAG2515430.1 hypothetical protein JM18_008162 [Phytophthora kernoviae]KAG2522783.1 hypothetical protein JM16_004477 [Phytophthora kernoviae]